MWNSKVVCKEDQRRLVWDALLCWAFESVNWEVAWKRPSWHQTAAATTEWVQPANIARILSDSLWDHSHPKENSWAQPPSTPQDHHLQHHCLSLKTSPKTSASELPFTKSPWLKARFLRRFHTMQGILIESLASGGEGPYDMIARQMVDGLEDDFSLRFGKSHDDDDDDDDDHAKCQLMMTDNSYCRLWIVFGGDHFDGDLLIGIWAGRWLHEPALGL